MNIERCCKLLCSCSCQPCRPPRSRVDGSVRYASAVSWWLDQYCGILLQLQQVLKIYKLLIRSSKRIHGNCACKLFISLYHNTSFSFKPNPLTAGAAYIRVFNFYKHINYHILNMLKIKCDINQQDLKRADLHFVKSEWFSLTWSCGSRKRDTTSSGWKFKLNNLAVKGLKQIRIHCMI